MAGSWKGTRADWAALADELVEAALARLSPDGTAFELPGPASRNGSRSDALEGFARVFQLYAFAAAGGSPRLGDEARAAFLRGLAAGTLAQGDEPSPWPAPGEPGNTTVNLGAVALGLRLLGPGFWEGLDEGARERLVDWLGRSILLDTPDNNWVLFRLAMRSFLASIGRAAPEHDEACAAALARIDEWYEPESGWYSDGGAASYDYYNAFELHFLPPLLARLDDWEEPLQRRYRERLDRFLDSYPLLLDRDGRPVYYGRSLAYRFAVAAPFAVSALVGGRYSAARAGERASAVVRGFVESGALDGSGLLGLGWFGRQPALAQGYSAPGAAYFAGKAFAALLLPPEHLFWAGAPAPARPAGVAALGGTGLLVETAPGGGLVRLVNHGVNERHATTIAKRFDEPLYSRLGYSTATAPVELDGGVVMDRSVVLVGREEPSARGRIEHVAHGRDWASSRSHPRRRTAEPVKTRPEWIRGKDLTSFALHQLTVVRGGWHVDVCVVPEPLPAIEAVHYGGWAVPDGALVSGLDLDEPQALARSAGLESEVVGLHGYDAPGYATATTPQPFGATAGLPYLRATRPRPEAGLLVLVAASRLDSVGTARKRPPRVELQLEQRQLLLRWGLRRAVVRLDEDGLRLRG